MDKHTPGPWKVDFCETVKVRNGLGTLATLNHVYLTGRRSSEEVTANAHLIAAAPDLLEALEQITHWCQKLDLVRPEVIKANAAIAKARGETP